MAYRQDQLPSTHPIAADIVDLEAVEHNFDQITYAKGASVLVQLVAFVGLEAFLAGARDYFRAHAYGNTTLADLLQSLKRTSGRDLSDWSRQWLETAGVNTLRLDLAVDEHGLITSAASLQTAPDRTCRRCASTGSRSALYAAAGRQLCPNRADRDATSPVRGRRSPSWSDSGQPRSWSTTTT